MKTMKILLIGLSLIASNQFVTAQAKPTATKVVTTSASVKATTQKAILPQVEIAQQIAQGQSEFAFLGTYNILAGVQKTKIGFFTLQKDGVYKVTVNSDENSYAQSSYEYSPSTKTLKWTGGLFLSNQYGGQIIKGSNSTLRIQLSKSTYAEKID
jgi:hypothetical protein